LGWLALIDLLLQHLATIGTPFGQLPLSDCQALALCSQKKRALDSSARQYNCYVYLAKT
jgi:hypothetical protein